MKKANKVVNPVLLVTVVFLLQAGISAHAANLCRAVFTPEAKFTKMEDKVTDQQVEALRAVVSDVNDHLGELSVPQNAEIKVFAAHEDPASDPVTMIVNFGVRLKKTPDLDPYGMPLEKARYFYKSPTATLPILAHEYGHLVFAENYKIAQPEYREIIDHYNDAVVFQKQYNQMNKKVGDIEDILISGKFRPEDEPQIKAEYKTAMDELFAAARKVDAFNTKLRNVHETVVAYNEFFADVIAVLQSGKPDAVSSSLAITGVLQSKGIAKFVKPSNEQRNFDNHRIRGASTSDHNFFSIARDDIWDSYFASPSYRKEKRGVMISAVFAAIVKEHGEVIKNPDSKPSDKNWKELNDRMMNAIDQEMAARNIQKLK